MGIALGQAVFGRSVRTLVAAASLLLLAACGGTGFLDDGVKFSSSEYGVAASSRVVRSGPVPRGGGRYMVGQPYKVAGRWYRPEDNPNYDETGTASWYGPNFHGRLTANGEIFDRTFLSAASPTLPLPSYVRVFNLDNGHSVIVRVNDRGPYAHNRLIDVSEKAAQVLGFANSGTAHVRVTYVGKAPLEGDDRHYLVASIDAPNSSMPRALPNDGVIGPPRGRPSPISREAGGLVGSFLSIFAYADSPESGAMINDAFAATSAMAARADALDQWRQSMDEDELAVNVSLGTYLDAGLADDVARHFAMIGAVDYIDQPAGGISLRLTHLKPGVTRTDLRTMLAAEGLAAIEP